MVLQGSFHCFPRRWKPLSDHDAIRTVVLEELARLHGPEPSLDLTEFQERLKVMTETILALQKRIDELGARGSFTAADMQDAVDSLKSAESLTNSEKAVLVNIFRKNVTLQKPDLIDADLDDG